MTDTQKKTTPKIVQKTVTKEKPAQPTFTREERWYKISEAAYLRAEKRKFTGDGDIEDWLASEAEIDAWLASRNVKMVD